MAKSRWECICMAIFQWFPLTIHISHWRYKSSAYTALFAFANSLTLYVVGPNIQYAQCSFIPLFSPLKNCSSFFYRLFSDRTTYACVGVRCASTQNPNIVSNKDRFFCLNNRKQKKKNAISFRRNNCAFFQSPAWHAIGIFTSLGQQLKRYLFCHSCRFFSFRIFSGTWKLVNLQRFHMFNHNFCCFIFFPSLSLSRVSAWNFSYTFKV